LKSATCVPEETTLISLAPLPLLELICLAADRQPTAVWLTLAGRMVTQLDPPSYTSLRAVPSPETQRIADSAAQSLTLSTLRFLGQPGAMDAVSGCLQYETCLLIFLSLEPRRGASFLYLHDRGELRTTIIGTLLLSLNFRLLNIFLPPFSTSQRQRWMVLCNAQLQAYSSRNDIRSSPAVASW
jgi:hypothetical protein